MKSLLRFLSNYKKETVLAPLFKLLEACFELIVPLVVASMIDVGIAQNDKGQILRQCLILVAFGIVGMISAITAQYFAAKAAVGFAYELRHSLYEKINSFSYTLIDKTGVSTLLTRLTGDVDRLQNGVNLILRLFLRSPFIVFGAIVMACYVDAGSSLVFIATVALLSIVVFSIMQVTIKRYKEVQARLDGILCRTKENLDGARVIRAFCSEEAQTELFIADNKALSRLQRATGKISALSNPLTFLIINAGILVLIKYGNFQLQGERLTQGELIALYNYMSQILVELVKLANLLVTVTRALASADRVAAILKTEVKTELLPKEGCDLQTAVKFDAVTKIYNEGAEPAVKDISFTAKQGELIGIIGGTGSGKTTLVNLIAGFYRAEEGRVSLYGSDVKSYTPQELREKIAVVMQRAVLFAGTLRENLCWGKPDATPQEMEEALKAARAYDFVAEKGGLDMPISQEGRNLSGGQRQRLTIARALVAASPILILDDAASALDYMTEKALRRAIAELEHKPTVFIVSQRTSSIMHADKIIVLDEGRQVGLGTHSELLENCPVYREIYESQFGAGEVRA